MSDLKSPDRSSRLTGSRRILVACFGTLGEVIPVASLARRLGAAGHFIHVCGPGYTRHLFDGFTSSFTALPSSLEDESAAASLIGQLTRQEGFERLFAEIDDFAVPAFKALLGAIAANRIDLVLYSLMTPAAELAARHAGIESGKLFLYPLALFQNSDPPLMPRWPRMTSETLPLHRRQRALSRILHHYNRCFAELSKLAAKLGLARPASWLLQGNEADARKILCFDSRLLLAPESGAIYLALPQDEQKQLPHEVDRFLQAHPRPIVISLGSILSDEKRLAIARATRAARALSLPVLTITGYRSGGTKAVSRPGSLVIANCPLPAVARHASLVIHHGGAGSMQETLLAGKPSLVLPGKFDQFDNARRLATLGLGISAGVGAPAEKDLPHLLERALADKNLAARCLAWKETARLEPEIPAGLIS